jgi:hypothetical protein
MIQARHVNRHFQSTGKAKVHIGGAAHIQPSGFRDFQRFIDPMGQPPWVPPTPLIMHFIWLSPPESSIFPSNLQPRPTAQTTERP